MRISELLGSDVVDGRGKRIGRVHDLRLGQDRRRRGLYSYEVVGVVIGPGGPLGRAAHAWGYAEGRARAPWLLRVATAGAIRESRFVPAERVRSWGPGGLRISGSSDDLAPLTDRLGDE